MDILVAGRDRSIHLDGIDCTIGIGKNTGNIGVHENPTIPRLRIVCQRGDQICRCAAKAVPGDEKGARLIIQVLMSIGILLHGLPDLFLKVLHIVIGHIAQEFSVRLRKVIADKLSINHGAPDNDEHEIHLFAVQPDRKVGDAESIFTAVIEVFDICIFNTQLVEELADLLLPSAGRHTEHRTKRRQFIVVHIGGFLKQAFFEIHGCTAIADRGSRRLLILPAPHIRYPHIVSVRPPAIRVIHDNPIALQMIVDRTDAILEGLRGSVAVLFAPNEITLSIAAAFIGKHICTAHLDIV